MAVHLRESCVLQDVALFSSSYNISVNFTAKCFIPLSALSFDQLSGQGIKEMHDKAAALIPMLHPHDFGRQSCCLSQRNQATDMQHIGTAAASAELAWLGSS
ncbi:unnamed protein product [Sphagnum troendelagicum]|uniref:Uncharacterized protein n=1 Tax=Sphagnum troendelagicum TaxID=128251 RepID=A0ABP0V0G6_9BRYO